MGYTRGAVLEVHDGSARAPQRDLRRPDGGARPSRGRNRRRRAAHEPPPWRPPRAGRVDVRRRHRRPLPARRWRRCSAPGGWWILDEAEFHLGADVVVPDVAGWRRGRLPKLPDGATIELAPDWVCEVTSPRTNRLDRVVKRRAYARADVTDLWLVDPLAQTLVIYRLEGAHWVVAAAFDGVAPVRAEPFDAVEVDLSRWWTRGADLG